MGGEFLLPQTPSSFFPCPPSLYAKVENLLLGLLQNLLMSFANSNKGGQPRERMGGEFAG